MTINSLSPLTELSHFYVNFQLTLHHRVLLILDTSDTKNSTFLHSNCYHGTAWHNITTYLAQKTNAVHQLLAVVYKQKRRVTFKCNFLQHWFIKQ